MWMLRSERRLRETTAVSFLQPSRAGTEPCGGEDLFVSGEPTDDEGASVRPYVKVDPSRFRAVLLTRLLGGLLLLP